MCRNIRPLFNFDPPATDDEIREGIKLLAGHEGIFTETAGGVTVGVAKKLIASGKIPAGEFSL